jgi:hypothetical protein
VVKSIWSHSPPAGSDPEYKPVPESYNPVPEVHVVDADKSNAYSGFAPVDEVTVILGVNALLTSPTTVDNKVQVVPSVDVATAVGEPYAVHFDPFQAISVALVEKKVFEPEIPVHKTPSVDLANE